MKNYSFDLDIDPMTLIPELDLDIVKILVCTENESNFSLNRHTHILD